MASNSLFKSSSSDHDRNYATALHHAHQIRLQKEASTTILTSTETLLDTPLSTPPSPTDIQLLKTLLPPFQPADYDALIHERNINSKCGYPLCPRPRTLQPTSARGKYRLLFGKGRGPDAFRVVEAQELEKWCSDECGRRALFLRVQLREEPAWLRGGASGEMVGGGIKLLEEEEEGEEELLRNIRKLEIGGGVGEMEEQMKALALERGDEGRGGKMNRLVDVGVRENVGAGQRTPVAPTGFTGGPGAIEGYEPRNKRLNGAAGQDSDDAEDDEDIIDTI